MQMACRASTNAQTVPVVLQSFLPNLVAILQRGKDNAAIFQVLEGYLVTADLHLVAAMLDAHMPQIAASLLGCLNAVLQVAQKAQTGMPLSLASPNTTWYPDPIWCVNSSATLTLYPMALKPYICGAVLNHPRSHSPKALHLRCCTQQS